MCDINPLNLRAGAEVSLSSMNGLARGCVLRGPASSYRLSLGEATVGFALGSMTSRCPAMV